jgi:hypothetical protein
MMPNRTRLLRRSLAYLALVPITLFGTFASSAAVAAAVASTKGSIAVASTKGSIVLSGGSVGPVHFGEPQEKAAGALRKLIGAAKAGVESANGNCTIDAAMYWANFSVYFFKGTFVGYQTGNNLTGKPGPTFNGATSQGLRVGDTLAEMRKLYPGRVTTSGENGGVYAVRTPSGTIRGYLSLEVSSPPTKTYVVTISAGSVGCPAASPG